MWSAVGGGGDASEKRSCGCKEHGTGGGCFRTLEVAAHFRHLRGTNESVSRAKLTNFELWNSVSSESYFSLILFFLISRIISVGNEVVQLVKVPKRVFRPLRSRVREAHKYRIRLLIPPPHLPRPQTSLLTLVPRLFKLCLMVLHRGREKRFYRPVLSSMSTSTARRGAVMRLERIRLC